MTDKIFSTPNEEIIAESDDLHDPIIPETNKGRIRNLIGFCQLYTLNPFYPPPLETITFSLALDPGWALSRSRSTGGPPRHFH
ncbi:hypothetical protein TNCV_2338421 [Trichonephila clavipes]|nr:hypothetical protein TNCV_2338421 [Trichonephila clavipes]